MANYTPDAPYILGQEWVPIKEEPYTIGLTEEKGTTFNLLTSATVVTGRFYVSDPAPFNFSQLSNTIPPTPLNVSAMMAIYPKGTENKTGPLKSVVVPCNGGSIDGDFNLSSATDVANALARAGDGRYIYAGVSSFVSGDIFMNFAFNDYPELAGKRIVQLEFLFSGDMQAGFNPSTLVLNQDYADESLEGLLVSTADMVSKFGINFTDIPSVVLPRFNQNWGTYEEVVPTDLLVLFPWTYEGLKKLDANTVVNPQAFNIELFTSEVPDPNNIALLIEYAAIRVTYCEEQRVAFGGKSIVLLDNSNSIQLRDPTLASIGVNLPAGEYTVTMDGDGVRTELIATKELYPMSDQQGVTINRTTRVGSSFTAESSDQLLQLSLHTASASVAEVHGYGTQVEAQVSAGVTATQEIVSQSNGVRNYPNARFYARRFGDTTQPLTLRSVSTPTITASISVTEFDALEEIVDGWKEVNVQFTGTVPSFDGSGSLVSYEWVSNEQPGDNWEVLGASAFVRNGTFPLEQITGAHSLNASTYGEASANLTWNGSNDITSDGVLMFAQEMPAVSGLSVVTGSLTVTGIGQDCGINPACIPTGISYNQVTWTALSASSMPASGFGFYELQRYDGIDDEWNTILYGNSPLVTGFSDYEARIGVVSRYRIRFQHRLLFPSAWSAEVSNTLPAPGVSGNEVGNSAIVFTTNEVQNGSSSLAYTLVWESNPTEDFTFLEAETVQLQRMYQRDFQVAFRPLERGGERFQRTLVVQGAAVPSGLIRDGFRSLRDLAWEQVSYVCVRNELGDRWYATVLVPSGRVMRDRRLYLAQVDIIEVTDTPSIVNIPEGSGTDGNGIGTGACFAPATWDGLPGWDYGCWT